MNLKKVTACIFNAILVFVFSLIPFLARAQMFSVDKTNKQAITPGIAVYAGIEPMNFEYQGNNLSGTDAGLYSFNGPLLRLLLEGPGIDLSIGSGGNLTGLDNTTYFDAGIKAGYEFSLYRTKKIRLHFPVLLHSSYTSVANDEVVTSSGSEFQQGTFEAGAGIDFVAKITSQFRVGANFIPSYGFAFSTRQQENGGSIFSAEGKARLYFDHLFGNAGLSVGYNYNFRQFDIDGQTLDYNATGNSFLIGITF